MGRIYIGTRHSRVILQIFCNLLFALFSRIVKVFHSNFIPYLDRVKRIWYLSPMRAAKVQASLRIRAVSPEPTLLAHTRSESKGTFRQKARSLGLLSGWACAVKIYHDGMLEDTNSLDGAHFLRNIARNKVLLRFNVRFIFIDFCTQTLLFLNKLDMNIRVFRKM